MISKGILSLAMLLGALPGSSMAAEPTVANAAMRGEIETLRILLRQGADVNEAQGDGMTALHWAAERGNVQMAQMLLYAGANPGAVTRIGDYTPLHLASQVGNGPVIAALLEAGSDASAVSTAGGATPLHFAAASGDAEAVTVLLDHGADPNAGESSWGQTPLMFAAGNNRLAAVTVLIERGADVALATQSHRSSEP